MLRLTTSALSHSPHPQPRAWLAAKAEMWLTNDWMNDFFRCQRSDKKNHKELEEPRGVCWW